MDFFADIIKKEVIDKLPLKIAVNSKTGNTLYVSDTYFLRKGSKIKDDGGFNYQVSSFKKDEYIIVNASGFSGSIHCERPKFMWGTQLATNAEYLQKGADSEDKLPMIWLLDNWQENLNGSRSGMEGSVNCRLFFIDTSKFDMINDEIKDDWQKPMFRLSEVFMQTLENNISTFDLLTSKVRRPRTRFGTETEQGTDATIIDDELTGCELICDVNINRTKSTCVLS